MITYIIIDSTQVSQVDFNQVLQTEPSTLRLSLNGLQALLKWDGDQPPFVANLTSFYGPYNHEEIMAILASPAWTDPNPPN
tara:strand:+ start:118 stop:360 length:243 start_codon:yes stop_codon:yes gene_type:complete